MNLAFYFSLWSDGPIFQVDTAVTLRNAVTTVSIVRSKDWLLYA
jgi:hypothetical protein